jgi:hypothetical protein
VPAVIAFHNLAAGGNDLWTADAEAAPIAMAPMAVDGIGQSRPSDHDKAERQPTFF